MNEVRSRKDIALACAYSGVAAQLLEGGTTAHSRFKIPLETSDTMTAGMSLRSNSTKPELIRKAKLLIWDEISMSHKHIVECVDRLFKEARKSNKPFGGITVLFSGDFKQVLPVVLKGLRADIVDASLTSSHLWDVICKMELTENIRLKKTKHANKELQKKYSKWIEKVGEGLCASQDDWITIPEFLLTKKRTVSQFAEEIFPKLNERIDEKDYFKDRAILAPTNEMVDLINDIMTEKMPGEAKEYLSTDYVSDADSELKITPEFLNSLRDGLPPHSLRLKIGMPLMCIRNLSTADGLANGTRLKLVGMHKKWLEVKILTGPRKGEIAFIPKIKMTPADKKKLGFTWVRYQFPVRRAFAITINKAQGQSLNHVGIFLPEQVFSHGQFYTAISRTTDARNVKIWNFNSENGTWVKNIVWTEVLRK